MESGFQLANRQAKSYEELSSVFMGPSAKLIVEAIELEPGDIVLDLACGTGLVARCAWPEVAPQGRVVGVDVNKAMLTLAQSIAAEYGLERIEWVESSAQHLDLGDDAFTHVACQQGLQFFPEPLEAVCEVHRVLRPGALFVATIWATPRRNPYIETQLTLLAELEPDAAASARAATPLAADELLRTLAATAGFSEISLEVLEHAVEVPDLKAFFLTQTASTPWASVLAALTVQERDDLADTFVSQLATCLTPGGGHLLPFCSHLLTARK